MIVRDLLRISVERSRKLMGPDPTLWVPLLLRVTPNPTSRRGLAEQSVQAEAQHFAKSNHDGLLIRRP